MLETKAMLDDQQAKNYPRLYADIRSSYANATQVGDAIAPRIAARFPDKFPGDASGPAVDLRAALNIRFQEHSVPDDLANQRHRWTPPRRAGARPRPRWPRTRARSMLCSPTCSERPPPLISTRRGRPATPPCSPTRPQPPTRRGSALSSQLTDASVTASSRQAWLADATNLAARCFAPCARIPARGSDDRHRRSARKVMVNGRGRRQVRRGVDRGGVADLIAAAASRQASLGGLAKLKFLDRGGGFG